MKTGSAPGLHLNITARWLPLYHPSLGIVRWDVPSGETVSIPPAVTYVAVVPEGTGATTLYLPEAAEGATLIVKDETGTAATFPITLSMPGGIVESDVSYTINQDHGAVTLLYVGDARWIIQTSYP